MRLAIINDTHLGARGDSLIVNEFFFKFWENTFFPYVENPDNKIERILHLGDFVDRRKYTNHVILHSWKKRFFERLPIHMDILVGNHDAPFRNTNTPNAVTELFGKLPYVTVYENPSYVMYDGFKVLLLPWINQSNSETAFKMINEHSVSHIFGHLEIAGFEMDRGNVCHDGIDRKIFDKYEAVYSGHFHHKSTDGTITYLGNQYEITWADYDDPRGFHVFDTDTRQMEFIPNPHRLFYKHVWDNGSIEPTYETVTDKYVKIIVKNREDNKAYDSFVDKIIKLNPADYEIVEATLGTDTENTNNLVIDENEDIITSIGKYVSTLDIKNMKQHRIMDVIRDIHLEALQMETK